MGFAEFVPALISAGGAIGSALLNKGGEDDGGGGGQQNLLDIIARLSQLEAQRRQQQQGVALPTPPFNPNEPVGGGVPDLGELGRLIPPGPGGLLGKFGGINLFDLLRGGGSFQTAFNPSRGAFGGF